MDNIFEWAQSIDKGKRNKPNAQLQQQLFNGILATMKEEKPSFSDCVNALMKFDKKVLEPFYADIYPRFSQEQRAKWDAALYEWACGLKPTENATIRIAVIIKKKLLYLQSIGELEKELKWLSVNSDKRSTTEFEGIRDGLASNLLMKLLALDISSWTFGKAQIEKMFSIIFSKNEDADVQKNYHEFLLRNGFAKQEVSETTDEIFSETDRDKVKEQEPEPATTVTETKSDSCPPKEKEGVTHDTSSPTADVAHENKQLDGVSLAEELLKWSKEQKENLAKQAIHLSEKAHQIHGLEQRIAVLTAQMESKQSALTETQHALEAVQSDNVSKQRQIEELEARFAKADEMLGCVQQMSENTAKQNLDGFKHTLSKELSNVVSDLQSDYSDCTAEELTNVYHELIADMLEILAHNGIEIEER